MNHIRRSSEILSPPVKSWADFFLEQNIRIEHYGSLCTHFFWKRCTVFFFLILGCSFLNGENSTENTVFLSNKIKEYSRREGYLIAEDAKSKMEWIDISSMIEGMQDYISGMQRKDGSIPDNDFYMIAFQLFELESKNNLQKAINFLQTLSSDATLHSLEDGQILYKIITEGQDIPVVEKDSCPVLHYTISTLSGQEVVNTRDLASGPFQVPLSETVSGFARGVEGMRLGERRKIFIHPDLGYGQVGQVPPNSLLIVDVEVMKI